MARCKKFQFMGFFEAIAVWQSMVCSASNLWYNFGMENAERQWFESEAFWKNFSPVMFDEVRWAEAPGIAEAIFSLAQLEAGSSVLDAGCGLGRISVELAALGAKVTGIDLMQCELEAARDYAGAAGVSLELVQADLRTFSAPKQYDCAINIFTSFGYCATLAEDALILKNIVESVKAGGCIIIEGTSREIAVQYFTEGEWFERAGLTVLTSFEVVGAWEGLRSKWTLIDKQGKRTTHEFVQRLYAAVDLKKILLELGCVSVEIYGDFNLSPYDHKAQTMVLVARK